MADAPEQPVVLTPVAEAQYKLAIAWLAVSGAKQYLYQVEWENGPVWTEVVSDGSTAAKSAVVPVRSRGSYRCRVAVAADEPAWSPWLQVTV